MNIGETLTVLSSVSFPLHLNSEVGFVVLDFEVDLMTTESLRDSCVRSSIVVKIVEYKASLMSMILVLAKANFHFAQEATLIYILEFSLNKTYAQSKLLTNLLQYASRVWGVRHKV